MIIFPEKMLQLNDFGLNFKLNTPIFAGINKDRPATFLYYAGELQQEISKTEVHFDRG
ncbi:Uncharacterised protein [Yersinia rohdei]|uniref:Uncharacterized protein n=1 Tax=Yersinia rohdei TaxID=29485 RepID=A0A0U1HVI0_YERRO|nr:Uncharacterised protein [Yersinia rohdei]